MGSCNVQVQLRPRQDYVACVQQRITSHMRAVLVDWLIEVSDEFKLVTETLYLTVSYIDRFLSVQSIDNSEFQLLGVACMCIASKYEEIHPPQMERFSYITDHVCTVDDISEAEAEVLQALQFRLATPTAKVRFLIPSCF
jgi:cyclin-A